MYRILKVICLLLPVLFIESCDTTRNIDPPDEHHFLKYFGGEGDQEGVDMVVNADGTLLLFGNTYSEDKGTQLYLVNADENGQLLWEQTYGGPFEDHAVDIELTDDGRIVLVANSEKSPGETDILLMTLSLDGAEIKSTLFGLTSAGMETIEEARSVTQISDGFIVSGSTTDLEVKPDQVANDTRDALHVRFNDDLSLYPNTWRLGHGPGTDDVGVKVIQVSPTQFHFFGYSNSVESGHPKADYNFWIYGLGENGETTGNIDYAGTTSQDEKLSMVTTVPVQLGEGFLLSGTTSDASGNKDIYLLRLSRDLIYNSTDHKAEKNLASDLGVINDLRVAAYPTSTGFLVAASKQGDQSQGLYVAKLDNGLNFSWNPTSVFISGEFDDQIGAVAELPSGQIVILGTIKVGNEGESKMVLIKLNRDGQFLD